MWNFNLLTHPCPSLREGRFFIPCPGRGEGKTPQSFGQLPLMKGSI